MVRPCYLSTPRHFLPAQLFLVSMATKATFIAMLISKKKKALISFPALHPPNKENTQWKSTHKTAHLPLKGSVSESNPSQQDVHIQWEPTRPKRPGAMFELLCLGWSLVLREMTQVLLGKVNRPKIRMLYEGSSYWPPLATLDPPPLPSGHVSALPVSSQLLQSLPHPALSLVRGSWLRFGPTSLQ